MCTILVVHLLVVSVIVALTKNRVQVKYYIFLIYYHFTKVGFIVLKKEKKIGKTALNFNIWMSNFSKGKKKTTSKHNVLLALPSKNSFLET